MKVISIIWKFSYLFCLLINMDVENSIISEDLISKHFSIESSTILI